MCKSCRTCFKLYCMFYFTCDRSLRDDGYLSGRLDGPTSSTLRSLARFNSGGHSSETEGVDGDIMDAVIRTATASMDRRPLRDRRRPSPASSASSSRDSVERQKCQFFLLLILLLFCYIYCSTRRYCDRACLFVR